MEIPKLPTSLFDTSIPKIFNTREEALEGLFCHSKSSKKCSVFNCNRRAKLIIEYTNKYIIICDKCYYPYWNISKFINEKNLYLISNQLFKIV